MDTEKNSLPTVDEAIGAWRDEPSNQTAATYLLTVLDYVSDGMLGNESLYAAIEEVGQWLISADNEADSN